MRSMGWVGTASTVLMRTVQAVQCRGQARSKPAREAHLRGKAMGCFCLCCRHSLYRHVTQAQTHEFEERCAIGHAQPASSSASGRA